MEPKGPAAYISEFVGTFFLVLGICGVVSSGAGRAVLTDVALAHTLVLMSLVYALGSISRGHAGAEVPVLGDGLDLRLRLQPGGAGGVRRDPQDQRPRRRHLHRLPGR